MSENFLNLDVKWINVFQNGDMYTPPVKFVVYRKHLRNFDVFLNSLTQRLKPRFGAIRNLYTPIQGHKITSLDGLEPNQNYVAAGTEKFRKVRYGCICFLAQPMRSSHYRPFSLIEIQPVVHSAIKVASRYKTAIQNSAALTIFVYRNGDDISPPKVVPLVKKDLRNWDVVLKRVSEKILPFTSCHLRRLCSLNGAIVSQMTELCNGEYYVAVIGRENFKAVSYGMLNPPVSRKFTNWSLADFASPNRRLKSINFSNSCSKQSTSRRKSGRIRLYATKKKALNKTNSLPMFHPRPLLKKNGFNSAPQESNVQENVFSRLYRPPSVVKFAKSDLNINQKSKHLQPLFKRVENSEIDSISEKGFKNSQREYQRLKEEKKKYKDTLRSPRSELQRVNKLGKSGKRLVNRSDNELQKLIDIESNSEEELEKLKDKSRADGNNAVKHSEGILEKLKDKSRADGNNAVKHSEGILEKLKDKSRADGNDAVKHSEGILQNLKSKVTGIKDSINHPGSELQKQKKALVEKVQGQDSSNTHQVDLTAEEELGEKPFIVLSIIERINPFRGRMGKNKSNGAESKDKKTNSNANNSKTNANSNGASAKTGKTSSKEKNAKTNDEKVKGVENNKTKDKDKSTKQQEKDTGSETDITDNMQLFGGYQPHKISKEKIKIRNELLDENRRSSFSYMNGDDQLPLPVNLENTQNSPEWNNDYYLKDEEEEQKKMLSQPAWYNPPSKERHRAGYDSGRTQSTILNDRAKHKLFSVNKQTSSKSNSRIREVNYDEDNSGVYRAKMRKDSQAQMINENENTAVELPLDELDAEEIKDEEIIPLTRKPARELHSNVYDENSSMDATHPSVQLYVDEKDPGANSKNRLCNSPKEQRDAWCNEMRKLKDRILSKIHSSSVEETLTKIDITEELNRSSTENTTRQRPLKTETHRLGKDQWVASPVKKTKSKLRKPRIFTNKSTSSCASDATTYTVESSSSSDNARHKSSTEETTDSSKLPVVRTIRHSTYCKSTTDQSTPLTDTSPTATSPQTSTQSYDPCVRESATTTNDSYVNDLSISDMNSYRELFNKTYIFDRDSLEDILGLQMPTVENSDLTAFDELPSGNNDFPTSNSFKSSAPFVQCGSDRMSDKQSVKNYKNSFMNNGISHININSKCYTAGAEDGRQLKYFQDEIDLDSLK